MELERLKKNGPAETRTLFMVGCSLHLLLKCMIRAITDAKFMHNCYIFNTVHRSVFFIFTSLKRQYLYTLCRSLTVIR